MELQNIIILPQSYDHLDLLGQLIESCHLQIINMRHLLLLDINGVLCRKIEKNHTADGNSNGSPSVLRLGSYDVELRPGARDFLTNAYNRFTVGFFSSTTYRNAHQILDALLTKEQKAKTCCFWYRDRTRFDPDADANSFDTIKLLDDIYQNPVVNEHRIWSNGNTVLIDDSFKKNRFNRTENFILV